MAASQQNIIFCLGCRRSAVLFHRMRVATYPLHVLVSLLAFACREGIAADDEEKTLRIDSQPSGAHVVIDGRDRG